MRGLSRIAPPGAQPPGGSEGPPYHSRPGAPAQRAPRLKTIQSPATNAGVHPHAASIVRVHRAVD